MTDPYAVTIAIPTIPPRVAMLTRAVASGLRQMRPAAGFSIACDNDRQGAWANRTAAVAGVTTPWVALLDDDDILHPDHLSTLVEAAQETGADYLYTWPDTVGGINPLQGEFDQWEVGLQTTTTVLVRTELARLGWTAPPEVRDMVGTQFAGEDYRWTMACHEAGAKFHHVVGVRTWTWNHHGLNTSGMPNRW